MKAVIIGSIIAISTCHYLTPTTQHAYHEIYRRLYFFPILLAAMLFGFRIGILTAAAVTMIYLPHVVFQWSGSFTSNLVRFNEIILYLLIGSLAGLLSDRTSRERDRYREAAEELKQAYQQLKEQSDLNAELEHQLRSADRLAVLGELTASLAHEVRNPLGSIRGAADIIAKSSKKDKTVREFTQVLASEVDRLNKVVDNYLSMVRQPRSGKESSNIIDVMESVFRLTGPQIRRQNIEIRKEWPDGSVFIPLPEVEAMQVFLNLTLNALAALEQGGTIDVRIVRAEKDIHIIFSDDGPGIPENEIDAIFKPFFTTKKKGSGLGLAIVKRLMESRQGTIRAENRKDQGACFIMTFPGGAES